MHFVSGMSTSPHAQLDHVGLAKEKIEKVVLKLDRRNFNICDFWRAIQRKVLRDASPLYLKPKCSLQCSRGLAKGMARYLRKGRYARSQRRL